VQATLSLQKEIPQTLARLAEALLLQGVIGNQAVQRLLQRHTPEDEENAQRQPDPSPAHSQLVRRLPLS